MAKMPVALQLYSIRQDCARDLPGCLEAVAKMGYDGVEFAGYYDRSAEELRKLVDSFGLKVAGTHIGLDTLLGDPFHRTVEFNQILGNKFLIVPWLPEERRSSRAAWLDTAKVFNQIAERLEPTGLYTGYHNHHIEFTPVDGEVPWDTFFGNTRKDVVMQFDIGNALHGGGEAAPFLKRYPGRALSVHLKEYSQTNDKALIGEGDVPWEEILSLCEGMGGTEWYVIEQESYPYPPLECVDKCLQNLRALGR